LPRRGLDRRLTFYAWESADEHDPFDRLTAAAALRTLPDDSERKYPYGDFSADVLLVSEGTIEEPTRLVVHRCRPYEDRPHARAPGRKPSPIQMQPTEHTIDVSHCVIWPDGYAAFSHGGHAPPPSYLSQFLLARTAQAVVFVPLFDRTLLERLKALKGVRAIDLRIKNSAAFQDERDAELGSFLGLWHRFRGTTQEVEVSQSVKILQRGKGVRRQVLDTVTPEEVIKMASQADALCEHFTVTGVTEGGGTQHIDLLHERLHVPMQLPRASTGGHYPDDDATFRALIRARQDLEADGRLQQAAHGKPPGIKP
jgi:hypothetical protein